MTNHDPIEEDKACLLLWLVCLLMVLGSSHYWLHNARVPHCLLAAPEIPAPVNAEGLSLVDIEIQAGRVTAIQPAGTMQVEPTSLPTYDLHQGQVWPCFVDIHTHLDKGHLWNRSPNPDGTFASALAAVQQDAESNWTEEDVFRRMDFGAQCSYVHGTQALRTHIDCVGLHEISFAALQALRAKWQDKLIIQAVSLVPLDYFLTPAGEALADQIAEISGVLGGLPAMNPELDAQLDRVFALAKERQLNLDFHTDESTDPNDTTLQRVAAAALRHQFTGQIVCGHCCSLSVQNEETVAKTMGLVKQAGIGIVSLPLCNLYLQDRQPNRTPRWRGVTLLHELKQQRIPVCLSSDNCRDPFHGFGDHDVWEVLMMSTRIAHLDRPYSDWPRSVTMTPAQLMGLPHLGKIAPGCSADLILFKARNFSELFSRSQHDRIVLRQGIPLDLPLPDYAELDDLCGDLERSL